MFSVCQVIFDVRPFSTTRKDKGQNLGLSAEFSFSYLFYIFQPFFSVHKYMTYDKKSKIWNSFFWWKISFEGLL